MKEWDELTLTEKIDSFPERPPPVFKAMLYLAFCVCPVPWSAVDIVMRRMGYEPMDVRLVDGDISFGAPTYACPDNEPLNTADDLYGR